VSPAKRRPAAPRSRSAESEAERRRNHALREVLDELVQHVRVVARTLETMTPAEVNYAQERLEWLADEVWRIAAEDEGETP
jgi:hypothetical protein